MINLGKSFGDKRGLEYLNESTMPSNKKINFIKAKKVIIIVQPRIRTIIGILFVIGMMTLVINVTLGSLKSFISKLASCD